MLVIFFFKWDKALFKLKGLTIEIIIKFLTSNRQSFHRFINAELLLIYLNPLSLVCKLMENELLCTVLLPSSLSPYHMIK